MQQRTEPRSSPDDFPTPPWAARALMHSVISPQFQNSERSPFTFLTQSTVLDPACGRGHMLLGLAPHFQMAFGSDLFPYGWSHGLGDFIHTPDDAFRPDFVITNPPFKLAEAFAHTGLRVAKRGVALLVRAAFTEGVKRYENLFREHPPTVVAQFTERVPMYRGRIVKGGTTATAYAWVVWDKAAFNLRETRYVWIPPCRRELSRDATDWNQNPMPPGTPGKGNGQL